jgi:hypothetical protein
MPMPEAIAQLQKQMETGGELPIKELRDATWQAARYLVFALGSGNPDQLGPLCNSLTQLTERYFDGVPQDTDSPQEWMRSLAVIGQIATGAYESFGPSAEARKVLEGSEHARNIIGVLVGKDRLQAAELRNLIGMEHQSLVARIMHTLSRAQLVIVERGPGNTAWYRLTAEGRRAAKATMVQTGKATEETPGKRQLAAAGASSRRW